MTDFVLLYITTKDKNQARKIARLLVEEKLIACANIIPTMTSVYSWKGVIHYEKESVLICKTLQEVAQATMKRVQELHSYECPCILSLPIKDGNPLYLAWMLDQLKS